MSCQNRIPFNRPGPAGGELEYIRQVVDSGRYSGDGPFAQRCCKLLAEILGSARVFLTPSCTDALELCALLLDLGPGDEVIMPSFTFVSTANAFVLRGVRPVFADIRPDTLNLDEEQVAGLIGPRTKAIVPVHYAGVACEMDRLCELGRRHGLDLIEDAAHALCGSYRGRPLGSFGSLATLSFHETKNFTCGEGGALLINQERYASRAEILRDKGTNRSQFFRGEIDKYTWVDIGSSHVVSELSAAFLLAQLEARKRIQEARRRTWAFYLERLEGWAEEKGVGLPTVPAECASSYHLFYLLCPSESHRERLIQDLDVRGVATVFHYVPLHLSPMGRRLGYRPGLLPVTEDTSPRLLRLPLYASLTEAQQEQVCTALIDVTRDW